jgi:hypothetical protein
MPVRILILTLLAASSLSACTTIAAPEQRRGMAESLAAARGWHLEPLPAGALPLAAILPAAPARSDKLTIYIEGDGLAWIGSSRISPDPTPVDPLALRLALAHPGGAAAYLGRPCQYVADSRCNAAYWTGRRFAPEVVSATGQAVDLLKLRFGATRLTLVGYSGGAAVAMLVAARRTDVARVVTVAGNLDHKAWTSYHRVDPLTGSLNPADGAVPVAQWHFVGQGDTVIPPRILQAYAERFEGAARPMVQVVPGFDHHCCWAAAWPRLWNDMESN